MAPRTPYLATDESLPPLASRYVAVGGAAGVGGIAISDQALLAPALLLAGLGVRMALAPPRAD